MSAIYAEVLSRHGVDAVVYSQAAGVEKPHPGD
jgi:hypothetical protein